MCQRYTGEPFTHGESLIDKVQFGWGVFDEDLDEDSQHALLEDILNYSWDDDDGEPPVGAMDDYVSHGAPWHDSEHDKWTEFCSDVRHHPETPFHFEEPIVEDFGMFSVELPEGHLLSRARLGCERNDDGEPRPYTGNAIGPPPVEKASAGRGNRQGQVVLYCADDDRTAVAEMRPARGMLVSVCTVRLRGPARIAANDYNLNISRYVSTARLEAEVDLAATHAELVRIEDEIRKAATKHNEFLKELGLPPIPLADS